MRGKASLPPSGRREALAPRLLFDRAVMDATPDRDARRSAAFGAAAPDRRHRARAGARLSGRCCRRAWLQGHFLTDAEGRPIANDFVDVCAAGRWRSRATRPSAYDWPLHKAAEVRAVGHDFPAITAGIIRRRFCLLPLRWRCCRISARLLVWLARTLAAYAATLRCILGDRAGVFVRARLSGRDLERHRRTKRLSHRGADRRHARSAGAAAGARRRLLGLLTYKPQFGLLFPLVLIADRRWLTIAVAAAVAIAHGRGRHGSRSAPPAGRRSFTGCRSPAARSRRRRRRLDRLQSLFGLVRAHGGSEALAWSATGRGQHRGRRRCDLAVAQPRAFELKAAALAAARSRHALCLHVRPGRARGRGRLFAAITRWSADLPSAEICRPRRRRRADSGLSLCRDAGRSCRRADRAGADRQPPRAAHQKRMERR